MDLQRPPYTTNVVLSDGGVYDNLGLETAWKRYDTILVSDAGGKMQPEGEPKSDWARHAYRVLDLVDNQVRSLRKRQVIESFRSKARKGAYWGIRTNIAFFRQILEDPAFRAGRLHTGIIEEFFARAAPPEVPADFATVAALVAADVYAAKWAKAPVPAGEIWPAPRWGTGAFESPVDIELRAAP